MPVGHATRGTTNPNRLRRVDRWLAVQPVLRDVAEPVVVDLGYGASGRTLFEMAERLHPVNPRARFVGIEIDAERVERAQTELNAIRSRRSASGEPAAPAWADRVSVHRGGFEVPLPNGERVSVIRALNVLRQYDEPDVPDAWRAMLARLGPSGLIIDGTCSEIGRVGTWIALDEAGPVSFTISLRLADEVGQPFRPSVAAERLPKALIHRNVPGERVHEWLRALDAAWDRNAGHAPFGAKQRFAAAIADLKRDGWPVRDGQARWRMGEVTVPWEAVAPVGFEFSR